MAIRAPDGANKGNMIFLDWQWFDKENYFISPTWQTAIATSYLACQEHFPRLDCSGYRSQQFCQCGLISTEIDAFITLWDSQRRGKDIRLLNWFFGHYYYLFYKSVPASSFGWILKSRERKICNGMFEDHTVFVIHYCAKIPLPISLYHLVQSNENSDQWSQSRSVCQFLFLYWLICNFVYKTWLT